MKNLIQEIALTEIGETYATLRIIHPKSERAIEKSLEMFGQISPVVCVKTGSGIELVDGFKRLRASRHLKWPTIKTLFLETTLRAGKAGMIRLNRISRSITDLEEAMILQSLHRDDGLSQVEIGVILGRDKSWVSRRLSLIERLADEVRKNVELGLISSSVGRELARLPRGNQPEVLPVFLKHRLGKREAEKLVRILLSSRKGDWEKILSNVWNVISHNEPSAVTTLSGFSRRLDDLRVLQEAISRETLTWFPREERPVTSLLLTTIQSTKELGKNLEDLLGEVSV